MSTVKVLDEQQQILFECPIDQADRAWEYARQMDEMGIAVKISAPSLPESLAKVLGSDEEELTKLRFELDEELDSHIGCCHSNDQAKEND
tara:strand:- start:1186 stop:1455 length:270 start_codon:yes stop_codon:yes gene_type:complete